MYVLRNEYKFGLAGLGSFDGTSLTLLINREALCAAPLVHILHSPARRSRKDGCVSYEVVQPETGTYQIGYVCLLGRC